MIKISEDMRLCLHPAQRIEVVTIAPQAGPAYQKTSRSPVKGMLRRRTRPVALPFYRAVCPECGAVAVSLYWPPSLAPMMISKEKELT